MNLNINFEQIMFLQMKVEEQYDKNQALITFIHNQNSQSLLTLNGMQKTSDFPKLDQEAIMHFNNLQKKQMKSPIQT